MEEERSTSTASSSTSRSIAQPSVERKATSACTFDIGPVRHQLWPRNTDSTTTDPAEQIQLEQAKLDIRQRGREHGVAANAGAVKAADAVTKRKPAKRIQPKLTLATASAHAKDELDRTVEGFGVRLGDEQQARQRVE